LKFKLTTHQSQLVATV